MATIQGTRQLTYRDIVAGLTSAGKPDRFIVELFLKKNPFLDDMIVMPANDGQVNQTTIRAGLPEVSWTGIYEGPRPSKGSKKIVKDAAGVAESMIEAAKKLYDKAPDKEFFMLDQAETHVQAMGKDVARALIYGNIKEDPKQFNGLAIRYPLHGGTDEDETPFYVINGSRTANNTTTALRSIWLCGHGSGTIHGFYPEGATGGLKKGPVEEKWNTDDVATNGNYKLVVQQFSWEIGLAVKDFRYAGRISNIESEAMFAATGMPDYLELLRRLMCRVESDGVNQAWYMDKLCFEMIQVLCGRKTQANAIRSEQLFERKVTTLFGIPVRVMSAMNVNEDATTAAS